MGWCSGVKEQLRFCISFTPFARTSHPRSGSSWETGGGSIEKECTLVLFSIVTVMQWSHVLETYPYSLRKFCTC
jgi:hypothetical protein